MNELFKNNNILKPKKSDIFILLIPILIAVISLVIIWSFFANSNSHIATIKVNGKTVAQIDLSVAKDGEVDLPIEPYNHNKIEIKDGAIGIVYADCKDKTCVKTGFISKSGQVIACVPSKLIITIGDSSSSEYDAITK